MTSPDTSIAPHADSLIEILAAQCSDLEMLLLLARRETVAAEAGDFDEIMRVVEERATLGERLEIYHRQIAEMRARMEKTFDAVAQSDNALRTVSLIASIHVQDARTRPLLLAARAGLETEQANLNQFQRGAGAYLQDKRFHTPVACDQRA